MSVQVRPTLVALALALAAGPALAGCGGPYTLQVTVNNFTGSGKQTGNVVITLVPGTDTAHSYSSLAESPTVVMTDKQSGTFDGNLRQGLDTSGPAIHVQGTFHC